MDASDTHELQPAAGQETVITFVLSGPILAEHGTTSAHVAHVPAQEDVAALRHRVEALERALAEAGDRLDTIAATLAAAVAAAPAPTTAPHLAVVPEPVDPPQPWTSMPPPGAVPAPSAAAAEQTPAAPATAPAAAAPAPAPKVRGLRRMISVLKHD